MLKYEFESIAGYRVSSKMYDEVIEPMYMASPLDKFEFVKGLNRIFFEDLTQEQTEKQTNLRIDVLTGLVVKNLQYINDNYRTEPCGLQLKTVMALCEEISRLIGAKDFYVMKDEVTGCHVTIGFYNENYDTLKKISIE